jgi:hypothetical protein
MAWESGEIDEMISSVQLQYFFPLNARSGAAKQSPS